MPELDNPADINDVTARAFRTLNSNELSTATVLIEDAWHMLMGSDWGTRVRAVLTVDPDTNPSVDPTFLHNVKRLLANSVIRVVNNPTGNLETEGDDYRARKDKVVSSGRLYFLAEEMAELFPTQGTGEAFTIRPGARWRQPDGVFFGGYDPSRRLLVEDDFYEPIV